MTASTHSLPSKPKLLTLAEVLQDPLFETAQVVAGMEGLEREVAWVHNAGTPDAPLWLNGGELVLTTMINMPPSVAEQRDYVRQMAEKSVAGLCITVGRFIERIPDHLRETADELAFPLVEIPYTARFVDIAKAVNERITQNNMRVVERALHIHQTLTQLVLKGGELSQLAERLAELVGHSISIETERFEAIATCNVGGVDEARRYTQQHGRTNPLLVEALEARGYLPELYQKLCPVRLPPLPDVGLEMERLLAPIVVHGAIYGFMWIIADNHGLERLDMLAIESGATIAALMMLHQETIHSAEASLKGNMLSQLIQGEATQREAVLTDQSLRYGVDLRSPYVMLLVDGNGGSSGQMMQVYRAINQLTATHGWHAVVGQFAGQVVVLVQANQALETIVARILERHTPRKPAESPLRIGISAACIRPEQVRLAHQQCRDALAIQARLAPHEALAWYERLGYLHTLYQAGSAALTSNPYAEALRRLVTESEDLFGTLEAYLDAGGNGVATADALHIHRSTLNYRLTRITQLCAVDLQDPLSRVNLQVALKLLRLFEVKPL